MKIKLRHNTLIRLISGSILILVIPFLLYLILSPFLNWHIASALICAYLVIVAYGFIFGWRHIIVRTATCESTLLPKAFDGYRILQLTDIHIGTYLRNRKFIDRLVEKTNEQHANLIVFTGDLVNVEAKEVIPFKETLHKLSAPDGIYSIMGNHDYCEYVEDNSKNNIRRNCNILQYMEEKMGWHLLNNENVRITRKSRNIETSDTQTTKSSKDKESESSIYLIGVENISKPPFQDYGDLKKAMEGMQDGTFKILLNHDPSNWRKSVLHQTDIALTLSGHTHAGQIKIGKFSPVKWAYHEWGGKYTEGKSMLYVSMGIGGTVPFRIGAWPEINIITLQRKPKV